MPLLPSTTTVRALLGQPLWPSLGRRAGATRLDPQGPRATLVTVLFLSLELCHLEPLRVGSSFLHHSLLILQDSTSRRPSTGITHKWTMSAPDHFLFTFQHLGHCFVTSLFTAPPPPLASQGPRFPFITTQPSMHRAFLYLCQFPSIPPPSQFPPRPIFIRI